VERPDIPPPRMATFFDDLTEDIIDIDERMVVVVKGEAGKRRDDRRVNLVYSKRGRLWRSIIVVIITPMPWNEWCFDWRLAELIRWTS
jgi:hypothetical protein